MAQLEGFSNRFKLTIPGADIGNNLPNFPTMIYLHSSSGKNNFDTTSVFDELSYANRKRIAVTTNDGTTQCPVEIAYWNNEEEKAVLWTKIPTAYSATDTDIYFYYDATYSGTTSSGNTGYVAEISDTTYQMVINYNTEGTYDTLMASKPWVIKESDTSYKMWYSGQTASHTVIMYATSNNGIDWSGHQRVINYGNTAYDTLNVDYPCVIKESDTSYKMWYAVSDSAHIRIQYATSTNGVDWSNYQMVININSEGNYDTYYAWTPRVIKESDTSYKIWYSVFKSDGHYRIMYATSSDGINWSNFQMVLAHNSEGTYDTVNAYIPLVIKDTNGLYRMWYAGYDGSNYRLIYADSSDGLSWGNFKMVVDVASEGTYDTIGASTAVVISDDINKMWYSGYDGSHWRIIYTTYWQNPVWDVWDDNFVAVYHAEQSPTGTIYDSTQYKNHGTPGGGMTPTDLVDGSIAKALTFDGNDDYIDCGNDSTLQVTSEFSAEFYFNINNLGANRDILGKWNAANTAGWGSRIRSDSTLGIAFRISGAAYWGTYWSLPVLIDTDYYGAFYYPGNGTNPTLYVNSSRIYLSSWYNTGALNGIADSGESMSFGRSHIFASSDYAYFPGIIDEVRISNIERTQDWINATRYSNEDNLIVYQSEEPSTTEWLSDWAKRISITIDHTNIDSLLINYPFMLKISSDSGITGANVNDVFDSLTTSGTEELLNDTCDGIFNTNWTDHSNYDSYSEYNSGRLSLDLNNGSGGTGKEGINALSNATYSCDGIYTFEFDWYPVDGSNWSDDNFNSAENTVKIVRITPSYWASGNYTFNRCELNVGQNSYLALHLRSTKSGQITIRQRISGSESNVINEAFTYGESHHVKWVVNFNNNITSLYMDGGLIASNYWDSSVLLYIGNNFKLNFHWNSYYATANQQYDNITVTKEASTGNELKIAVTTEDGTTQCYTEVERWSVLDEEAILWVKAPIIYTNEDTTFYLYYDVNKADNTDYIGNTADMAAQNVWNDNYIAVWHMAQDPSVGTGCMLDSTANEYHGTPAGSMTSNDLVDGLIGKAIEFDGSDDRIDTDCPGVVNINDRTIEIIVNVPSLSPSTSAWIFWGNATASNGEKWAFRTDSTTGALRSEIQGGNALANTSLVGTGWRSCAAVFHGGRMSDIKQYLDAVDDGRSSGTEYEVRTAQSSNMNVSIGAQNSGSWGSTNATICDLRISDCARNEAWIKANYYNNNDELVTYGSIESAPVFTFDGYVKVENSPAERTVYLFRRATGELIDTTTSNSSTGYFELNSTYSDYHFIVILPLTTETYNLLSYDKISPGA